MLVLFPFEEPLYREAGVSVTFVGHPLVDRVRPAPNRPAFLASHGLDAHRPLLALLPGSRPQEVAHNLPPLAGAVSLLRARRPDLQFALAAAASLDPVLFQAQLRHVPVTVVRGETHAVMGAAGLGLVASGTATVEAALLGLPMLVVYRLSPLTYALGRPLMLVRDFAMVNLIAGRRVVPELIQGDFTPERVASEAIALLDDPGRIAEMRTGLAEVRLRLGAPGASSRAAGAVLEVLNAQAGA
jgi:lipid-A-disaccharide synthase